MKLRVGGLFSGIGGIELGLERTGGFETVFQVEQDEFCRRVLAKHWPGVPQFNDVREVGAHNLPDCDLLCGGFPCQDLSVAGKGAGLDGERSGLWFEYARIIREIRPRYILVENVAALLARGIERVLGDLVACGYDAEWDCIPASAVGAPHERDRLFVVAYTQHGRIQVGRRIEDTRASSGELRGIRGNESPRSSEQARSVVAGTSTNPDSERREERDPTSIATRPGFDTGAPAPSRHSWEIEPRLVRVADGVPDRTQRLRAIGNAVVPQVAEYIGHRILAFHNAVQAESRWQALSNEETQKCLR